MTSFSKLRRELDPDDQYVVYRPKPYARTRKVKLFHITNHNWSEPAPFTLEPGDSKCLSGLGKNNWFVMTHDGKLCSLLKANREGYVDIYKEFDFFNYAE